MPGRGDGGRTLATVLFTDIVGSTELASRLGDEHWKLVLATHHGVVRKALKRNGGREIDTAGDGFFATFPRPADAIRCAAEIIDELRPLGIQIRAGVHMGEIEQMGKGGKVGGIGVHIGARVAAKAGASEILVSSTVRDLVAGSDIRFADKGTYDLKGVPGEWRLFSIDHELQGAIPDTPQIEAPAAKAARRRTVPVWVVGLAAAVVALIVVLVVAFAGKSTSNVVAVPGADTISKIDAKAGRFAGTTAVGSKPGSVTAGGGSLWVLNISDQSLARVDPSTGKLLSARGVGGPPTGVAFGAGSVWVTTQFGLTSGTSGSVLRFDPGTPGLSKPPIQVGNGVNAIAFGEGAVWVTNTVKNTVARIDPDTDQVTSTLSVGNDPEAIATGPGAVWVANTLDNSIWKIDAPSGKVVSKITLVSPPTSIAVDGNTVWVASETGNTVTRVDATTGTTVATIPVGAQPIDIAAAGGTVWVACSSDVERIDPSVNRVTRRLTVHGSTGGVVVLNGVAWVTVHA